MAAFLKEENLDYWKLYDSTNRMYLYVDEDGELATNGTSWNEDNMYWTTAGHMGIENKGTGQRGSRFDIQVQNTW